MKVRVHKTIHVVGLLLAVMTCAPLLGCLAEESKSQSTATGSPPQAPQPAPAAAPAPAASFINKVWQVSKSNSSEAGALRVFLSEGTLVMASPNSKPALGSWKYENGGLTIVEEGRPYQTDILKVSANEFQIKINGPGEPVEITFAPAETPAPK